MNNQLKNNQLPINCHHFVFDYANPSFKRHVGVVFGGITTAKEKEGSAILLRHSTTRVRNKEIPNLLGRISAPLLPTSVGRPCGDMREMFLK